MVITDQNIIHRYYSALINREEEYNGIFYVAVKTTSVFCIPTCRARKPKIENVEFFTTIKDALDNGYRPCKICNPTSNTGESPELIKHALLLVTNNPKQKITDWNLRQNNINPDIVRRWFLKNHGMTFHSYQRMFRINQALFELKSGRNITDAAYETGYESLSGFGYTFKKIMGKSPVKAMHKNVIIISRLTTPLGPMYAGATEEGICMLEFVDRRMLETEFRDFRKLLNAEILWAENNHIVQVKKELEEYFAGSRKNFDVSLVYAGSEFQKQAWKSLIEIPYGTTVSYQQQALNIGKPKNVRAVANANGMNRIAIMIPCHRVIGSNGKLTGYGGGLERKQWLIRHEKDHSQQEYSLFSFSQQVSPNHPLE